jgi:hypothetical protein
MPPKKKKPAKKVKDSKTTPGKKKGTTPSPKPTDKTKSAAASPAAAATPQPTIKAPTNTDDTAKIKQTPSMPKRKHAQPKIGTEHKDHPSKDKHKKHHKGKKEKTEATKTKDEQKKTTPIKKENETEVEKKTSKKDLASLEKKKQMNSWSLDPDGDEAKKVKAKNAADKAKGKQDEKDQAKVAKVDNVATVDKVDEAKQAVQDKKDVAKLPATAKDASKKENNAAAKMQAIQRGKNDRADLAEKKEAVVKIQAAHRGNKERKEMKAQGKLGANGLPGKKAAVDPNKNSAAARRKRKQDNAKLKKEEEAKKKKEEEAKKKNARNNSKKAADRQALAKTLPPTKKNTEAATKIQQAQRGKTSRNDLDRMLKEGLTPVELKEVKQLEKQVAEEQRNKKKTKSSPVPPTSPPPETEKRIDENDGRLYTKAQFKKRYKGLKEWNASQTQAQMLGQDAAPRQQGQLRKRRVVKKKKDVNTSIAQRNKLMQLTSGIELKALPFTVPKNMTEALKMLDRYRERELDLLEFQQLQAEKMSTLRKKAEKTVGSLSQEIEMMSSDLSDMRNTVAQEIKMRKKEERNRKTAEADAERLRRELRGERDELRLAVAKETELQIERDRLDAVLSKVGAGALDDLEARLQASEERRWQCEAEIEKMRTELNWQTNGRMDERLAVSQLEEELTTVRQSKRRMEVKRMQLEESLEQCMTSLRSKKRECADYRKRLEALLQQKGTGVLKGRFQTSPRRGGNDFMEDPIKPRKGGGRSRRAVLPPSVKKNNGANGQDLASLRRKISTLRQRVGGAGKGSNDRHRFGI